MKKKLASVIAAVVILASSTSILTAQDKLKSMPGYDQYQKIAPQIRSSIVSGSLFVQWNDDGSSFEYTKDGKRYQYDVKKKKATEIAMW